MQVLTHFGIAGNAGHLQKIDWTFEISADFWQHLNIVVAYEYPELGRPFGIDH